MGLAADIVFGPDVLAEIGVQTALSTVAAVTIVAASVVALRQDNLKRRLAFSTIAHLSYIVLGLSLATANAWNGAMLHIVNHAALKITLFFCAGAIYVKMHRERVSQLDGIGRQMPFTMAAFALAALGLAGVPPMGGFVSKWFLALGAVEADQALFAVVLLGSGLLTAGYLFPIVYRAFFRAPAGDARRDEASPLLVVPLTTTAVLALLLGLSDLFSMHALAARVAQAATGVGL
jgi:multicomponent Na+:H+ antiporter subunit D